MRKKDSICPSEFSLVGISRGVCDGPSASTRTAWARKLREGGIREPLWLEVSVIFSNQHHTNFVFNSISLILVAFFNEKRWTWNFF